MMRHARVTTCLLIAVSILASFVQRADAQLIAIDTTRPVLIPEVVITATRTPRSLERVPVPLTVIPAADIEAQAVTSVEQLISRQLGAQLQYSRFGAAGVQLQGLDAAYTLVLLDGEPLITNVDGFADLSRIPAANIERIEIIHGPSSSLYGSEALAGVVNIVTKRSNRPLSSSGQVQYGSHNTLDVGANVQVSGKSGSAGLFVNRNSTSGYDLSSELTGQTVPPYASYNVTGRGDYRLSSAATIRGTALLSTQDIDGVSALQQGVEDDAGNQWLKRLDWNIAPGLVYRTPGFGRLTVTTQAAKSKADANYEVADQPELQDFLDFDQFRSETELQYDRVFGSRFIASGGFGVLYESVAADFIAGNKRSTNSWYGFSQLEWFPSRKLDVIGSARVDEHPDYQTQFNPKLAASWTISGAVRLQASVGRGFKAPTYEQRYINFTNPLGGSYTVLGAEGLQVSFAALEEAGLVREVIVDPASLPKIRPESSWSYMSRIDLTPGQSVSLRGMLFHNDVTNLIETQVIAIATNGQHIYTYVNLGNVNTRGFQIEGDFGLPSGLSVSAGYQFLDAYSEDLDAPLGGRSRHTGSLKFQGDSKRLGASAYLQAVARSSYPFITGVGLTVDGSLLLDAVVTKQITAGLRMSGGIRNLLDYTAPAFQPEQPGRVFFVQMGFNY